MKSGEKPFSINDITPVLELNGIRVRGIVQNDLPHLFRLATSFQTLYLWDDGAVEMIEERFVDLFHRKAETHTFFVVQDAKETFGPPLGLAYIYSRDLVNEWAYYTIALFPEVRRKGIGCSATVAVIDYAFFTWSLHKIYIEILSMNKIALNTGCKIGFSHEATFKEHRRVGGHRMDVAVLSITRDHWYSAARAACLARLCSKKQK